MPAPYAICTHRPKCDQLMLDEDRACGECIAAREEEDELRTLHAHIRVLEKLLAKSEAEVRNLLQSHKYGIHTVDMCDKALKEQ